jgi:hypothetical protein
MTRAKVSSKPRGGSQTRFQRERYAAATASKTAFASYEGGPLRMAVRAVPVY